MSKNLEPLAHAAAYSAASGCVHMNDTAPTTFKAVEIQAEYALSPFRSSSGPSHLRIEPVAVSEVPLGRCCWLDWSQTTRTIHLGGTR